MPVINKDGGRRRTPTDNKVIKYGGQVHYGNNVIDSIPSLQKWKLNDKLVGSIFEIKHGPVQDYKRY